VPVDENITYIIPMKNTENHQPQGLELNGISKELAEKLARIEPKHIEEFRESAIDDSLIALNFKSLDGEITEDGSDVADHLLYSDAIARKNGGSVTSKHLPYLTFGAGWWCGGGIDLVTLKPMPEWGCLKPDKPQPAWKKDDEGNWVKDSNKSIKYHNPPLDPVKYFALRVTFATGTKIAQRHGLEAAYNEHQGEFMPSDEDRGFWGWVIGQKSIPLLTTEGAKKAACLLSHGYLSIALSGIWNACDSGKDTLKPGIAAAATGREVVIVFDIDSKEKTQKAVNSAAVKLSRACITADSTKITEVKWMGAKGVDDFIVKKEIQMFDHQMSDRSEVKELPKTGLQDTHDGNPCPVCGDTSGKCATGLSRTKKGVKVEDGVFCASVVVEGVLSKAKLPNGWEPSRAKSGEISDVGGVKRGKLYPIASPSGKESVGDNDPINDSGKPKGKKSISTEEKLPPAIEVSKGALVDLFGDILLHLPYG
jgi:Domain of unknown function (DUF3854)